MTNHLIERNRNFFLLIHFIDARFKKLTGHSMKKGPYDVIDKMQKPLLMLQSKVDPYSTAQNAQMLFDKCPSDNKKILYFDQGGHSLLRITDTEKYDNAIKSFLATL
jgi:esterase/lipase